MHQGHSQTLKGGGGGGGGGGGSRVCVCERPNAKTVGGGGGGPADCIWPIKKLSGPIQTVGAPRVQSNGTYYFMGDLQGGGGGGGGGSFDPPPPPPWLRPCAYSQKTLFLLHDWSNTLYCYNLYCISNNGL